MCLSIEWKYYTHVEILMLYTYYTHVEILIEILNTKTHLPFRKFFTSSEVPQNPDDLPSTRSQALTP